MNRRQLFVLMSCFCVWAIFPAVAQETGGNRLKAAPGPLDNPLKGWCPYGNAGEISLPYSMVFVYASWAELEPEEGKFAFDAWEKKEWARAAASGKHIVFRVYIDYPTQPSGLPKWLKAKGVRQTPITEHGGGLVTDYNDPRVVAGLERLIGPLGNRYDKNHRVAFIQAGLLGFWGEWHTFPHPELAASATTEKRVLDAFEKAFPNKIVQLRLARDEAGKRAGIGFHDDMFPEDTDNGFDWSFLAHMRRTGRTENWQRAAIGGEMVPFAAKSWLGPKYGQTRDMLERGHFSWVGPYCPAISGKLSVDEKKNAEALVRRMGYQFRLDEIMYPLRTGSGDTFKFKIIGTNEGVAPFYYPWPVYLAFIDRTGQVVSRSPLKVDIRQWKPGRFEVDSGVMINLKPGDYRVGLGVIDPWTDKPAISFANDLPRVQGWTMIMRIIVKQ